MESAKVLIRKYNTIVKLIAYTVYAGLLLIATSFFADVWNSYSHGLIIVSLIFLIVMYIGIILGFRAVYKKSFKKHVMRNVQRSFHEVYRISNPEFDKDCFSTIMTNDELADIEAGLDKDSEVWVISKTVKEYDLKDKVFFNIVQTNLWRGIRYKYFLLKENFKSDKSLLLHAHKETLTQEVNIKFYSMSSKFFMLVPYDLTIHNPKESDGNRRAGYMGLHNSIATSIEEYTKINEIEKRIKAKDSFLFRVHDEVIRGVFRHITDKYPHLETREDGKNEQ